MPLNPDSQFALYEPAKAIGNRLLASIATVQMHKSVFLARTCLAVPSGLASEEATSAPVRAEISASSA